MPAASSIIAAAGVAAAIGGTFANVEESGANRTQLQQQSDAQTAATVEQTNAVQQQQAQTTAVTAAAKARDASAQAEGVAQANNTAARYGTLLTSMGAASPTSGLGAVPTGGATKTLLGA